MNDRKPDSHMGEQGRVNRPVHVKRLEPIPTDWCWLDALDHADLESDFIGAVEEQAEDQERPELENLFD